MWDHPEETMHTENELEIARLLVVEAEKQIEMQQKIIDTLRVEGRRTSVAEKFLSRLQVTLFQRQNHRDEVAARLYGLDFGSGT
jgi:hypothetical protein